MKAREVGSGPLDGLRVLDFGQAAVGPICCMYLAMLGADVIKIERPKGDAVRLERPYMGGVGTTYLGNNLGKRGIVLDLRNKPDVDIAKKLVRLSDVVVDNFRSEATLARLGLGYEVLNGLNSRIVYLQSSAFADSRTYAGMMSNEWMSQAAAGFSASTGQRNGRPEQSRGTSYLDWFGAQVNLQAVLIALYYRQVTGKGMMIRTSQYQSSIFAGFTRVVEYLANGHIPVPLGSERANLVPDLVLRTRDGYLAVSAFTDPCWQRLCDVLDLPDLRDLSPEQRVRARDQIGQILRSTFAEKRADEWVAVLSHARIPYAVLKMDGTVSEILLSHPQVKANEIISRLKTSQGDLLVANPPWLFGRTPASIKGPSPAMDEHRREILELIEDA